MTMQSAECNECVWEATWYGSILAIATRLELYTYQVGTYRYYGRLDMFYCTATGSGICGTVDPSFFTINRCLLPGTRVRYSYFDR